VMPRHELTRSDYLQLQSTALKALLGMTVPVFATAVVAGIVAGISQVGFYITFEPLTPKWERIDPVQGMKRLLSPQGLIEAVKAVIKLTLVGFVAWTFLKGQMPELGAYFGRTVAETSVLMLASLLKLFFLILLAVSVLAGMDYMFQRWQTEKKMKMTRREAKDEFKLREGDPLIKSRIRSIQRKLANGRMMDDVPKADVVVTNPTHFAVALQYDSETMAAPKVVAKGAGVIALKIRELAKLHRVPIVENKPLARTMFKELQVGGSVPKELYKAVAEVLAYVYRLKRMADQVYGERR